MQTGLRCSFAPPYILLFIQENTLLAQRLDLGSLRLLGEAVTVADEVRANSGTGRSAVQQRRGGGLAGQLVPAGTATLRASRSRPVRTL